MALVSRHYKICEAVLASVVADSELIGAIPLARWRLQKKAWHRNQKWEPGGHVVPLRKANPPHENRTLRFDMPVLVAVVWPSSTDGLAGSMEERMAVAERIENIFAFTGRSLAPVPMRGLDSTFTGEDAFKYEQTTIQPGDSFMDGAFASGYDACATIVNVQIVCGKRDSSGLGA